MAAEDPRLVRLLDETEIRNRLVDMSRAADRRDRALFLSACHADAVISVGPFVGSPAELFDWSSDALAATNDGTSHIIANVRCDFDGDAAHVETYYLFVSRNPDATNMLAGGRYVDRFERRNGAWRLAVRANFIEWSSIVAALDNPLNAVPDLFDNGRPERGPGDISYARPLENRRPRHIPG